MIKNRKLPANDPTGLKHWVKAQAKSIRSIKKEKENITATQGKVLKFTGKVYRHEKR